MIVKNRLFEHPTVEAVFLSWPKPSQKKLLQLRNLIFEVADRTKGVGRVLETLKWNQPAYLTPDTKSGSTLRLGMFKSSDIAIYVHCQTTILSDFKHIFPMGFRYEGNRAIFFKPDEILPLSKIEILINRALTYHL